MICMFVVSMKKLENLNWDRKECHVPPISDHSSPEELPSVRSALSDSSPLDMIMSSSCHASVTGVEARVLL